MWNCIAVLPEYSNLRAPERSVRSAGGWQTTYCAATGAADSGAFFDGLFAAVFFATFVTAFFVIFFAAPFFARPGFSAAFAARNAAQRFFVAAAIARLPAALIFRLRFGVSDGAAGCDDDPDGLFDSAHRFFCASLMRLRAAALIFRRLPLGAFVVPAGSVRPSTSIWRSCAICSSIRRFWSSKPPIAATSISVVSFCVGI
jgi:hypothetical protein